MAKLFDKLKRAPVEGENNLQGLESIVKVFAPNGSSAFLTVSDLDLDTDGNLPDDVIEESTHQDQTSIDPRGVWLDSNEINFFVLPGGFEKRHGGVKMGCLCTVFYNGRHCHAIYADVGPRKKYGEGSIAMHRALGFERLAPSKAKPGKRRIIDVGIEGGVTVLIYIGSRISNIPCTQAEIDFEAEQLYGRFKD